MRKGRAYSRRTVDANQGHVLEDSRSVLLEKRDDDVVRRQPGRRERHALAVLLHDVVWRASATAGAKVDAAAGWAWRLGSLTAGRCASTSATNWSIFPASALNCRVVAGNRVTRRAAMAPCEASRLSIMPTACDAQKQSRSRVTKLPTPSQTSLKTKRAPYTRR